MIVNGEVLSGFYALTNPSNDLITTSYFAKYSSIMKIVHIRESFTPDRVGKLDPNMADMNNGIRS
ncbi:hypothetical protein OUZ56_001919 [Daphnia magna]|uniref:Uncharacterized protein n=1 Tax=Daphnia magna TaxID=35525 RepID=A0ABR0A450_9CRUS|nr:hypothetical protein OUZ56_001919 [Daphnia magna]